MTNTDYGNSSTAHKAAEEDAQQRVDPSVSTGIQAVIHREISHTAISMPPPFPTQTVQMVQMDQDAHRPLSVHAAHPHERRSSLRQALKRSIEPTITSEHEDPVPQERSLPSPPRSQTSGDESQPPQPRFPAAPESPATPGPYGLPSPASSGRGARCEEPASEKSRQKRIIPKQTKAGALLLDTPTTSFRRSTRNKRAPPRFTGLQFDSKQHEPAQPKHAPSTKIVVLNVNSERLRHLGNSSTAAPHRLNLPESVKRKHAPQDVESSSQKKSRKSNIKDQEAFLGTQAQNTLAIPPPAEVLPSVPAAAQPLLPTKIASGDSDKFWSLGRLLMTNAQPPLQLETPQDPKQHIPKPEPHGQPPVWSRTRFALCETVPNCLMYQGGSYTHRGLSYAYLYAETAIPRDYIDENVIIARAPGGMAVDHKTGQRVLAKDQTENAEIEAFRNAVKAENPIIIITKDNNTLIPSRMPHPYSVLGHFKATHMWWERQTQMPGSKRSYKYARFRFERLSAPNDRAWYRPKDGEEIVPLGSLHQPVAAWCISCRRSSFQVYIQGWMCLQRDCPAFWKLLAGSSQSREVDEDTLVYDPRFVKQKTIWQQEGLRFPLEHNPTQVSPQTKPGDLYSTKGWKGIVCPICRGCIMRLRFSGWICETPNCGYQRLAPQNIMPASSIIDPIPSFPRTDSYTPSRDIAHGIVRIARPLYANNYRMNRFDIPRAGFIVHCLANETVCKEAGGPDDMLEELQRIDIGLERRALGSEKHLDPSYSRHMNFNVGMQYKFAATGIQKSVPFEEAKAQAIRDVRTRLNWMMVQILARDENKPIEQVAMEWKPKEFNEELILGYFEDQSIGYHDDGEPGLGPNIATISLGDTGKMTIRMKPLHYFGRTKTGAYDYKHPPIPGCLKYEERRARHEELLRNAPAKNATTYWKEVAVELGLTKYSENTPVVLEMVLRHGDQVFMIGADIQTYYEHSVTHEGRIRFALTCRTIDPNSLKASDLPDFEVGPDTGHYDGSLLPLPRDVADNPIPNGWRWEYADDWTFAAEADEDSN